MNKLRYLKKGFSLMEIAIILVMIGVLFIAASSIIEGRSSTIEVTRTENRLQQIHDIIIGSAKYTGFLPADSEAETWIREDPIRTGPNTRMFSTSVAMLDGYGNQFNYKHGKGTNYFFDRNGKSTHGTTSLCSNVDANMTVDFHTPSMSNVGNVAYVVYSYGKNGNKEINITSSPSGSHGENLTIHIPVSDPGFDDKFQFLTLDQIKQELQCPMNSNDIPLEIYTKKLAVKPAGSGQMDTQPRKPSAPVVTRNIIYSSTHAAKWCIEVADATINQDEATKQIEAFRLDTQENYINPNETPVPVNANGGCANLSSFTSNHNDSASIQIVLNSDLTKLVPAEYYYNVHMYDFGDPSTRVKQLVKINVPNP